MWVQRGYFICLLFSFLTWGQPVPSPPLSFVDSDWGKHCLLMHWSPHLSPHLMRLRLCGVKTPLSQHASECAGTPDLDWSLFLLCCSTGSNFFGGGGSLFQEKTSTSSHSPPSFPLQSKISLLGYTALFLALGKEPRNFGSQPFSPHPQL